MAIKQKISGTQKQKLGYSTTLQGFQPILKCGAQDIESEAKEYVKDNPFVEIKSNVQENLSDVNIKKESSFKKENYLNKKDRKSNIDIISNTLINQDSIFQHLQSQISNPNLFPTKQSQMIAELIVDNLSPNGLLEISVEDLGNEADINPSEIERIRKRFALLEPAGVGATSPTEALLFQLDSLDIEDEEVYEMARDIIINPNHNKNYISHKKYEIMRKYTKSISYTPTAEFWEDEPSAIPDIFVMLRSKDDIEQSKDKSLLSYSINSPYYPQVISDIPQNTNLDEEDKKLFKDYENQAKNLLNALDMRRQTIEKIARVLLVKQRDFFLGGNLKPMKLSDVAKELDYGNSTISRAIENKYLECPSGKIVTLKSFFTTGILGENGDVSNATIKQYISKLIDDEDKDKPLSDKKILDSIKDKFKTKMERRTITKYRKALSIPSSSERKKLNEIKS